MLTLYGSRTLGWGCHKFSYFCCRGSEPRLIDWLWWGENMSQNCGYQQSLFIPWVIREHGEPWWWWWYRLGITPYSCIRAFWQSCQQRHLGQTGGISIWNTVRDFEHAVKSYDMGPSALVPVRRKVSCGFLSTLKIHRLCRVWTCDPWVQWQAHKPLHHRGDLNPGTCCIGGWVGLRAGLDTEARGEIIFLCRGSNPGRPVCSHTLFPLPVTIALIFLLCIWNVKQLQLTWGSPRVECVLQISMARWAKSLVSVIFIFYSVRFWLQSVSRGGHEVALAQSLSWALRCTEELELGEKCEEL
jgi:hypothetical protein